jgi:long-chain acyl-CoA synthetase
MAGASLMARLDAQLQRHAAAVAYHYRGHAITHGELDARAWALAAWLQDRGVRRGDRVALMLPLVPQFAVAALAALRAGAAFVPLDPLTSPQALGGLLKESGAQTLVVLENHAAGLARVLAQTPVRHVLLTSVGDLAGPVRGRWLNWLERHVWRRVPPARIPGAWRLGHAWTAGAALRFQAPDLTADDLACLQFSGGTMGMRRAAVLCHRQLGAQLDQWAAWLAPALQPASERGHAPAVWLCTVPPHLAFGWAAAFLQILGRGACAVLMPDPRDARALRAALRRQPVDALAVTGPLLGALIWSQSAGPEAKGCGALQPRLILCGGQPLAPGLAQRWRSHTGCTVSQTYGLAEAGPVVSAQPVTPDGQTDLEPPEGYRLPGHRDIGLPLPGTELAVLDEAARPLPPGQMGELAVRGPVVMAGYWQRPDETARAITPDGWLRTGDCGVIGPGGRFWLVERKADLLTLPGPGARRVLPADWEDIVQAMPGILEAAAVALPPVTPQPGSSPAAAALASDDTAGLNLKLVVVRKDLRLTEAQVLAWCAAHLKDRPQPALVEFRDALPRNGHGQVMRQALRSA